MGPNAAVSLIYSKPQRDCILQNYINVDTFNVDTMERPVKIQENPRYELSSVNRNPLSTDRNIDNKTTGKAVNQTKPKSTSNNGGELDAEKMVEIRQIDMSYDGGVYEVIANNSKALPQDRKLRAGGDPREAVYDTLDTIPQATQQQMDLFRRMMYLMTVLLLIVFLTAAASLALTVMMLISGNTLSLHQPTSSPSKYNTQGDARTLFMAGNSRSVFRSS